MYSPKQHLVRFSKFEMFFFFFDNKSFGSIASIYLYLIETVRERTCQPYNDYQ